MKKLIFLKILLYMACTAFLLTACNPVSDEAYYSALKATSGSPEEFGENTESVTRADEDEPDFADDNENNNDNDNENDLTITSEPPKSNPVEITEQTSPFDVFPLYSEPDIIEAPYGLCYNLTEETLIYGKNIDEKIYPASMTKLLTALVALKHAPDDLVFDIGNEVWMIEEGSSTASLETGMSMDLQSILTALLVPTGNDAAYTIAKNVAHYLNNINEDGEELSNDILVKNFISLMNEHIKTLNLQNSHFENPDGYHDNNQFSTVRDLLRISAEAAGNPVVSEICSLSEPTVYYQSGKPISWTNRLPFLGDEEWGIKGFKAGFIDESLYSASIHSEMDGNEYIVIVYGCESANQRSSDVIKLLSLARDDYHEGAILAYAG